jgi:isoleucyl-tRNA synthetase
MFKPVDAKINFPALEEEILTYWKKKKIFEQSVANRPEDKKWTFLDGPPFVTGMPHYGTLLSSFPKDVFGRYWTMKGYRVDRVWGWDGHGLPIENKVENKLKIERKKDIEEKVGVKTFIDECKKYVEEISGEWEWYVDHIGRWADFKNAYKTWNIPYMESVMWVFKQMYDKGHIYKGLRVSLYCPHCATPISNFEVAMDAENYKELVDPATTYKYQLADEENTYILAWSTTPWTKIVTSALAVNPDFTYVKVRPHVAEAMRGKQEGENYILAKTTLKMLQGEDYEVIEEIPGKTLIGKKFIPHYDYYKKNVKEGEKVFEIIGGAFVTADEGTGVVTIAAYGEEDLVVMRENNIHIVMHLDEEGTVMPDVPQFGGMYYLKANKFVEEDLEKRGLIYHSVQYSHKVPTCWRCHTRLYYAPQNAWYVNVRDLKPKLKETNESINWFPKHFKYGRFLKSVENAPDWNISRSRYWGSPVPVWECECGERFVPGSIKELEQASGKKINDLHKPEIDEVEVTCKQCSKKVKRVSEVLDSWIEAGSASFAERHFPFEEGHSGDPIAALQDASRFFPPDFIAEYTGQIRAWFYVLHVIGAALYGSVAFKNVIVEGVILGTDGRKMSKNFGNYPDPKEMLQKYGGDALRLYLLNTPVMHGEDIIISEEQYRNQVKGPMMLLWNVYNFFVTYALIDKWKPKVRHSGEATTSIESHSGKGEDPIAALQDDNPLDRWILSLLHRTVKEVTEGLDGFDTVKAIEPIVQFIDDFSKWYIRRSRDRVGPSAEDAADKEAFYRTSYEVLITICKIMAPIAPFMVEDIYRNLTGEESVHLADWPTYDQKLINPQLEKEMMHAREVASIILMRRKTNSVKVRIPLRKLSYKGPQELSAEVRKIVEEEANINELTYAGKAAEFGSEGSSDELTNTANQDVEMGQAREIVRSIQEERKKLGTAIDEKVAVTLPAWPEKFEAYIKRNALIETLTEGDALTVTKISK